MILFIDWNKVIDTVDYADMCRIPVVDYGKTKLNVETVAGLYVQPNTFIPQGGGHYFEVLRWQDIDKQLACTCRCNNNEFDWATVRRNINNMSKHDIGKHFVEISNLASGERAIKLTYFHKPGIGDIPDICKIRGYIKLPRLLVPIILKSCERKIDFAVYLIICNHYKGINNDRRIEFIPLSSKKIATELSYSEDEITRSITRLKNNGLIRLQDEWVVYGETGHPIHYRNIKVRELREWVELNAFDYDFMNEENAKFSSVFTTIIKPKKHELGHVIIKPRIPIAKQKLKSRGELMETINNIFNKYE